MDLDDFVIDDGLDATAQAAAKVEADRVAAEEAAKVEADAAKVEADRIAAEAAANAANSDGTDDGDGTSDDELILDANDNQVDKDGKIIKTKAELEAEIAAADEADEAGDGDEGNGDEGDIEPTIDIANIIEKINVKPTDVDGNVINFDNTEDGIQAYIEASANHIATVKMGEIDSAMVRTYPVLDNIITHLKANDGKLEGFNLTNSYATLNPATLTDEAKFDLVVKDQMSKGNDEATAKLIATSFKDSKQLDAQSQLSIKSLSKADDAVNAANRAKIKATAEDNANRAKTYWANVNSTLDARKALDINIPSVIKVKVEGGTIDKTADDFKAYMTTPIKTKGGVYTQYQIDKIKKDQERTVGHDVYDALMLFSGSNVTSLVDNLANSKVANDFKAKIARARKLNKNKSNSKGNQNTKASNSDIVF